LIKVRTIQTKAPPSLQREQGTRTSKPSATSGPPAIVGRFAAEALLLKGKEDYSLRIRYKNFRGDEMIYSANPSSGYIKNEHLVIRVAPTGRRITFRLSAIQNRSDVESQLPKGPLPNPQERSILNYYLRNGTTSRLFKQIREKYLDYQL
jgi:hypothetical protein